MNLDDLQNAWSQQTVAGPRVDAAALRAALAREVRHRGRRTLRIIGVAAFVFIVGSAVMLTAHFTGIKPFTGLSFTGFVIASLFDLTCFVLALRAHRRIRRMAVSMGETLADALQSSLRAVEWQMRDCVLLGYSFVIAGTWSILFSLVRYFSGDTPLRALVASLGLTALLVPAIALTLRRYYRGQLMPRREELQRELAELQHSETRL